jgi:peptidoglycan/LPS O-acetylase OafA/YrhL
MKTFYFMKNKITALLNVHILSIIVVIIIIAACDSKNFKDKFVPGIPSIFLVQMIIVWTGAFDKALIVPEWYLSSMLICMLFMVPIFLALTSKLKGIYSTLILIGIIAVNAIISGLSTKWAFNENLLYDVRAWGEMSIGMLSNYFSIFLKNKNVNNYILFLFKILEIIAYILPVILGIVPISKDNQPYLMVVTMVCIFFAVSFTFAEKGNVVKNEKVNFIFGYLGTISLPIYLFHPVIITLIDYCDKYMPRWEKHIIVFPITIILAFVYRIVADFLNKKIKEKKEKKEKNNDDVERKNDDKIEENVKDKQVIEINGGSNENLVPNK